MDVHPGDYLVSLRGRDKGRYFVAVKVDGEYVYLCDGDIRKIDKPKKKKLKHVKILGKSDETIAERLKQGIKVTNAEFRKSIARLIEEIIPE